MSAAWLAWIARSDVAAALVALHVALSFLAGWTAARMLRKRYAHQTLRNTLFFGLFALMLPGVGAGIVWWLAYYFKHKRHRHDEVVAERIDTEPFLMRFPVVRRSFGEGIAEEEDAEALSPAKRLGALSFLAEYRHKEHIAVIKRLLSSNDDEIRLLSFAIIDKLEQEIHHTVHDIKQALAQAHVTADEAAQLHKKLANAYWELIYFELADDTLKRYLTENIRRHVEAYEAHAGMDAQSEILLGKTAFVGGEDKRALKHFWNALGMLNLTDINQADFLVPYIAEIYYNQSKYTAVKKLMKHASSLELSARMRSVQEVWA